MGNKETEWYVVPGDASVNEIIARLLAQTCDADGNDTIFEDNIGVERKGWRVKYSTIVELTCSKKYLSLNFTVYVLSPDHQLPRQYILHEKKPKSAKLKKVEEALAKITKK